MFRIVRFPRNTGVLADLRLKVFSTLYRGQYKPRMSILGVLNPIIFGQPPDRFNAAIWFLPNSAESLEFASEFLGPTQELQTSSISICENAAESPSRFSRNGEPNPFESIFLSNAVLPAPPDQI